LAAVVVAVAAALRLAAGAAVVLEARTAVAVGAGPQMRTAGLPALAVTAAMGW
jgi:hypothetical protein